MSSILSLKFLHALHESLHTLNGLGIVAAGAESANGAVALDAHHALCCGKLEERFLEILILLVHHEADVHQ